MLHSVQSLLRQYQDLRHFMGPEQRARAQALRLAKRRAESRLEQLDFVDTRPQIYRSEAFAEDLIEHRGEASGLAGSRWSAALHLHSAGLYLAGLALI